MTEEEEKKRLQMAETPRDLSPLSKRVFTWERGWAPPPALHYGTDLCGHDLITVESFKTAN